MKTIRSIRSSIPFLSLQPASCLGTAISLPLLGAVIATSASAATLVDNMGNSRTSAVHLSSASGNGPNYYAAVSFTTGANASILTGAGALLSNDSGIPNNAAVYEASIWSNSAGLPAVQLATFDTTVLLPDNTGFTAGSFADTGISLAANTTYWFALRNTSSGPNEWNFDWGASSNDSETSDAGWTAGDGEYVQTLSGAGGWGLNGEDVTPLFSLTGMSVPEPSGLALIGLSGLVLLRRRRR